MTNSGQTTKLTEAERSVDASASASATSATSTTNMHADAGRPDASVAAGSSSVNPDGCDGAVVASGAMALSEAKRNKMQKPLIYVWTAIGALILCGVAVYLLKVLSLPVAMLIWTLVIVFILRGMVNGLEKRGVNRAIGTTLSYVALFVVLGLIGFLMFSPMFGLNQQFADLITAIPGYVSALSDWGHEMADKYSALLDNETVRQVVNSTAGSLSNWASSFAGDAANTAIGVGSGIANAFYAVGFALVIAFWVLLELPAMGREAMRVISPKHHEEVQFFHVTFTRILGGYLKGTLLQCFIIGVACGILFAIVGLANAPALGVITGVLNIIPIIGPWLGGVVAAITAVFVSPLTALIALAGTIVIQQIVYTFISPKIMSSSVDIHPVLTLVAMTFGSAIGGAISGLMGSLVGMLFAIPLLAVMKSIFIFYFERSTGRQIVSKDGFVFKGNPKEAGAADPLFDATNGNLPEERTQPHSAKPIATTKPPSKKDAPTP